MFQIDEYGPWDRLPMQIVDHIIMMQRPRPHPVGVLVREFWAVSELMLQDKAMLEFASFNCYEGNIHLANWKLLVWIARNVKSCERDGRWTAKCFVACARSLGWGLL